ncbi:hypothetical protein SSX86_005653 [Deinandra increscens subsp. villosa]|uniref:Serine/arginine repetitive matrix protein 1-like n=1 Tax=Deinandra increscens subsp. villosa TaxID=3103831 RepID=A0AAP0DMB1_9ASTR
MGCCLATPAANHRHPPKTAPSPSPPPPPSEEETVKEVLSETPIVPKTPLVNVTDHRQIPHPEEQPKTENGVVELTKNVTAEIQENVSEISEMYSYSESFSAATTATTVADANRKDEIEVDEDGEVTQKVKNKSPPAAKKVARKRPVVSSGEFGGRKERGPRPVARRQMPPSPEKKRQSPARTTANAPRNRNVGTSDDGRRREVTAARRSRSPAVRGEARQGRQVREKSPVKSPVKAGESEGKRAVEKIGDGGGVSPEPEVQVSESLENPLVSMECFIFL